MEGEKQVFAATAAPLAEREGEEMVIVPQGSGPGAPKRCRGPEPTLYGKNASFPSVDSIILPKFTENLCAGHLAGQRDIQRVERVQG